MFFFSQLKSTTFLRVLLTCLIRLIRSVKHQDIMLLTFIFMLPCPCQYSWLSVGLYVLCFHFFVRINPIMIQYATFPVSISIFTFSSQAITFWIKHCSGCYPFQLHFSFKAVLCFSTLLFIYFHRSSWFYVISPAYIMKHSQEFHLHDAIRKGKEVNNHNLQLHNLKSLQNKQRIIYIVARQIRNTLCVETF